MPDITLFELHVDGLNFGGEDSLFPLRARRDEDGVVVDADEDDEESGGLGLVTMLVLLLVVAAVGVAAKKFLGSDDDLQELEELDDLSAEA